MIMTEKATLTSLNSSVHLYSWQVSSRQSKICKSSTTTCNR